MDKIVIFLHMPYCQDGVLKDDYHVQFVINDTRSKYSKHSRKTCYMGHRRFLKENHPWHHNKRLCYGNVETRPSPCALSGSQILSQLEGFVNKFRKTQKKSKEKDCSWKKNYNFFELKYWKTNYLTSQSWCHAHWEKICGNVLGTLLDIPGKTKRHLNASLDLQDMGIRKERPPKQSQDSRHVLLPKAFFSMSLKEKTYFVLS